MTASLNPYLSQFSEEFDAEKSSQYRMAIQFSLDGLSFVLLDSKTKALVGAAFYQSDQSTDDDELFLYLERVLASKKLNDRHFQSVACIFDNRFCTLVPKALFNEGDLSKYLDFTFQVPEGFVIGTERIENADCYNVFTYPKALQDKVLANWRNAQIMHSSSLYINKVLESQPATSVSVNVRNNDFDMIILKKGKLKFFNNFKYNTKEDFAYFLLFAMEQNDISGHNIPVCFSGHINSTSEIIDLCRLYIKSIHFVEATETITISQAFNNVPFQYYFIHYQALR